MGIGYAVGGGVLGGILGGPLGAIIGAGLGAMADSTLANTSKVKEDESYLFCIGAVIAMSAKLAKADGRITKDEILVMNDFFEIIIEGSNGQINKEFLIGAFNEAKQNATPVDEYIDAIQNYFTTVPHSDNMRKGIMNLTLGLALADTHLSSPEVIIIRKLATALGFSLEYLNEELAFHGWKINNDSTASFFASNTTAMQGFYAILGVSENATMDEVRTAYRKKVKDFHPDKLAAKNLPEELLKFSSDKFNEIQGAYDAIKMYRNG